MGEPGVGAVKSRTRPTQNLFPQLCPANDKEEYSPTHYRQSALCQTVAAIKDSDSKV